MRLFFALWPEVHVREHMTGAAAALRLSGAARHVPPENFHATLVFIGDVAASHLPVVREIGGAQRTTACTIIFDAYEYWSAPQVVVAVARENPPALIELATILQQALSRSGTLMHAERPAAPLRAHVTLARKVAQAPVLQAMSPCHWNARAFSLVSSDTGGMHSTYTVVDTWPLLYEEPPA